MTLKDWMREHFFDNMHGEDIMVDGQKVDIEPDQWDDYEFVSMETVDDVDIITVKPIKPERQTLEIFCNYGVLNAEKRNVFTYGAEHPHAVCSDRMTVLVPEDWSVWKNDLGQTIVTAPWGWGYEVNEVLSGNEYPHFRAYDKDGKLHQIKLEEA